MAKLPTWQAHHVANYDNTMMARCAALLGEITSDPVMRREFLPIRDTSIANYSRPSRRQATMSMLEPIGARRVRRSPTEGSSQKASSSPQPSMNSASLTRCLRESINCWSKPTCCSATQPRPTTTANSSA